MIQRRCDRCDAVMAKEIKQWHEVQVGDMRYSLTVYIAYDKLGPPSPHRDFKEIDICMNCQLKFMKYLIGEE